MAQLKIGFIGAGNMASSIIGGLIANNFNPDNICISDKNEQTAKLLTEKYSIKMTGNVELAQQVDIVVLAVKPQVMKVVCNEIAEAEVNTQGLLFISIAAGINTKSIENWLQTSSSDASNIALIRCMPNTPALIQCSASGLFANTHVSNTQKEQTETIMSAIGNSAWVDEEVLIDSITAVSGSGPAYFFLLMEAMIESGIKQGLERSVSEALVKQTALGAARMFNEGDIGASQLRENVTSPGGTTEQALNTLKSANFSELVNQAISDANARASELSIILGK